MSQESQDPVSAEFTGTSGTRYTWNPAEILGHGQFATVYAGFDETGNAVAIKRISISESGTTKWLTGIYMASREPEYGLALSKLGAKHVLPVYDSHDDENWLTLVMQRADMTLEQYLLSSGPMTPAEAMNLLKECLLGVQEISKTSIVHRDLAPTNIFRFQDRWSLGDFGVSRSLLLQPSTMTWAGTGHVEYTAPEIFAHQEATVSSDLYALGCITLEALTGKSPFHADPIHGHRTQAPKIPAEIDTSFQNLLLALLAKNPLERPQSGSEALSLIFPPESVSPQMERLLKLGLRAKELQQQRDIQNAVYTHQRRLVEDGKASFRRIFRNTLVQIQRLGGSGEEADGFHIKVGVAELTIQITNPTATNNDLLQIGQIALELAPSGRVYHVANLVLRAVNDTPQWLILQFAHNGASPSPDATAPMPWGNYGSLGWDALNSAWMGRKQPGVRDYLIRGIIMNEDSLIEILLDYSEEIEPKIDPRRGWVSTFN